MKLLNLALFLLLALLTPTALAAPPGFRDELVTQIPEATSMDWIKRLDDNGWMLLVGTKDGHVYLLSEFDTRPNKKQHLWSVGPKICWNGGRGLSNALAHPEFATNPKKRWVYVYFNYNLFNSCGNSYTTGPVARVVRYEVDMDNYEFVKSSAKIFFQTPPMPHVIHTLGDMRFGLDGLLYITVGDGGEKRDDTAQDLGELRGVIVRLTEDGLPAKGNPFINNKSTRCHEKGIVPKNSGKKYCEEIWAYGFRNPFRFTMHPRTGDFYVNDVGGTKWEESSGPIVAGGNYGWKVREGPCLAHKVDRDSCVAPDPDDNFIDPFHWYAHTREGGAAVGCAWVPEGIWPRKYDNKFLFADYVFNTIYMLEDDKDAGCRGRKCDEPLPPTRNSTFHEFERMVQLTFGPYKDTQALYYTSRYLGKGDIRRIYYTGEANRGPQARLFAMPNTADVGDTVTFYGSLSTDADGDILTYEWDFGDGITQETDGAVVRHQYRDVGTYTAKLKVRDPDGYENEVSVKIVIGTAPTVEILSPPEGSKFSVGESLKLTATAVDRFGQKIPDENLEWVVLQHHNTHTHPYWKHKGNSIDAPGAPEPEDFLAATNSYLGITLTATDSEGVTTVMKRDVYPKKVKLRFESDPPGLTLRIDKYSVTAPITVTSWEDYDLEVVAEDQGKYKFKEWSNGSAQNHIMTVPPQKEVEGTVFLATFELVQGEPQPVAQPEGATTSYTGMITLLEEKQWIDEANGMESNPPGFKLMVEADGKLAVAHKLSKSIVWRSDFDEGRNDNYRARIQGDCNFVVKNSDSKSVWKSNSARKGNKNGCFMALLPSEQKIAIFVGNQDQHEEIWSRETEAIGVTPADPVDQGTPPEPVPKDNPPEPEPKDNTPEPVDKGTPAGTGSMPSVVPFLVDNVWMGAGSRIESFDFKLELQNNGRLVLSQLSSEQILWETDKTGAGQEYNGRVQRDCNLIIREGPPPEAGEAYLKGNRIWKSGKGISGYRDGCELAVLVLEQKIAIFKGEATTSNSPTLVWEQDLFVPVKL